MQWIMLLEAVRCFSKQLDVINLLWTNDNSVKIMLNTVSDVVQSSLMLSNYFEH